MALTNNHLVTIDPASPSWDVRYGNWAKITLNQDVTLPDMVGLSSPSGGVLFVTQDSTGGRILTLPGMISQNLEIGIDPGEVTILNWTYDVDNGFVWFGERIKSQINYEQIYQKDFLADFTGWTGYNSPVIADDGGTNKLHLTGAGGDVCLVKQSGLFTVGDVLRVTLSGVNIITNTVRFIIVNSAENAELYTQNLADGANIFSNINTTGFTGTFIYLFAEVGAEGFIGSIKIERVV